MNPFLPAIRTHASLLLAIFLSLMIVGGHLVIYPPDTSNSAWDSFDYKSFARNPFASTTPPFGYRPLSPTIVYLLPCSIPTGFIILTALSLAFGAVMVVCICRRTGLGEWEALAAIPLFLAHGGTHWLLNAPCHVDALSTLLSGVVILLLLVGYTGLAGPVLALGVVNKESALFLLPVYWVARWSRSRWKGWLVECLAVSVAALAIFWMIRYLWYPRTLDGVSFQGVQHHYDFFAFYRVELGRLWESMGRRRLLSPATYTFGAASLCGLAAIGVRGAPRELRAGLFMLPLVVLQLVFATGEIRLKHQVLPILLPLALRGMISPFGRERWSRAAALLIVCGLAIWIPDSVALGLALGIIAILARQAKLFPWGLDSSRPPQDTRPTKEAR